MLDASTVHVADLVSRCISVASHFVGSIYILRCWLLERRDFYLWFAFSWLLMSVRPALSLTLNDVWWVHLGAALLVSPLSAILGVFGYRRLFRYLRSRMSTLRIDERGEVHLRVWEKEKLK